MLSENIIRQVARRSGLSSICVMRLLGSVRVKHEPNLNAAEAAMVEDGKLTRPQPPSEPPSGGKLYQLGFNIDSGELMKVRDHAALTSMLWQALNEYKRVCPLIVVWVGRGDFNPNKIPENVTGGHILHANRTAGRLKARLMRQVNTTPR